MYLIVESGSPLGRVWLAASGGGDGQSPMIDLKASGGSTACGLVGLMSGEDQMQVLVSAYLTV